MVTPLDLEELEGSVFGSSFFMVQDLDGLFFIGEVGFKLKVYWSDGLSRNSQALLELGHMEDVVDGGKRERKLDSICHWSTMFRDRVGSDVSRS